MVKRGECDANIALKWMTEVSSSVYGTPLIHDLYSDGQKDVIVPSFVHYLEACTLCSTSIIVACTRTPSCIAREAFTVCLLVHRI